VVSALREQRRYGPQGSFQVKVDTDKLDNIVDMVGELAIAQSMLRQNPLVQSTSDRRLFQIVNQLNVITSSLQKTAMSLRMVPISQSFQKMLRLVRDLAKKAGKEVELRITGEETEIDRNMVEEIYEPMVHMIRNAIDHGIEPPEERTANRKPARGTIYLKAYHKGGDIVIEIADDGRGLNKEKIRQKAIANGLIEENENPSDEEIQNLIFQPGFSTADEVTDISVRGVGTDVVKSKIEKLRGRVEVKSTPGQGTRFFMRLPLTLAIVDGIVVKVGQERYILPTLSVKEFYKPEKRDYFTVKGKGEMIKVRQDLIPLVRLDRWANGHGGSHPPTDGDPPWEKTVVVVEHQGKLRCLLVDELVGQEEVVIKSLGQWLRKVEGIAGGAILGDGRVGLIVDISGVFEMQVEG
jgi:two-component system chemotaxis sensor kinase CheA